MLSGMDEPATPPAHQDLLALRVVAHPLRLQLLSLLTGSAMSAAEAARHLGQTQANVSYHLRKLYTAGLLEVAGHEVVRGGRATRYRHAAASGERLRAQDPGDERALVAALVTELARRTDQRDPAGQSAFTDAEVWLPHETSAQVLELLREAGALLHERAQPPHTGGTRRVAALLYAFEMTPGPTPAPSPQTGQDSATRRAREA